MNREPFKIFFILIFFISLFQGQLWGKNVENTQLTEDLKVIWPLLQTVKVEYKLTVAQLEFINSEAERKAFLEEYENFINKKYFKEVLVLNIRQVRLLALLIDRELGETPFNMLRDFRSLNRAVYWYRLGKMVGIDIREKYRPENNPEIEAVLKNIDKLIPPVKGLP
jgi:hypothetical protein